MHTRALQITKLIHENCGILMTFAFSRGSLERVRNEKFVGTWKYFDKMCFDFPEVRATRAALELAVHLRVLDDEQKLQHYLQQTSHNVFGTVQGANGRQGPLTFRDLTNKIVHSSRFDWDFAEPQNPKLVCHPSDAQKWTKAEIGIVALVPFCGELMS